MSDAKRGGFDEADAKFYAEWRNVIDAAERIDRAGNESEAAKIILCACLATISEAAENIPATLLHACAEVKPTNFILRAAATTRR